MPDWLILYVCEQIVPCIFRHHVKVYLQVVIGKVSLSLLIDPLSFTQLRYTTQGTPSCPRNFLPRHFIEHFSHMPSKGYHEDVTQTLLLSKPHSIKLIEDVPFQNMPMLHPDEEVSKENESGPLLNDDICITTEIHLSN